MNAVIERKAKSAPDEFEEKQLIAGLRSGDTASYEQLVKIHWGRMVSVARRLVQVEADAQDCAQEALLQVCRNIDQFEERSSLETWLHRIVVNASLMKIRARMRQNETSIDDLMPRFDRDGFRVELDPRFAINSDESLESRETRRLVRRAIDQLPVQYRTVLILRDIEGYNIAETATLLEVTPGTVKIRLHRARSALRKLLEPLFLNGRP